MSSGKHTHKLKRHTYSNKESVYFCVLDCPFKVKVELALGKLTVCWRCGKSFNINEYALRLAKPHCMDCKKAKPNEIKEQPSYPGRLIVDDRGIPSTDDLINRLRKTIDHADLEQTIEVPDEDLL